jgi:hypothetical protein
MDDEMILLDLKVNSKEALDNIVQLSKANAELKKQLNDVKKADKEAGEESEESIKIKTELNAQIKENNAGIRENTKELKTQSAQVATSTNSINAMRSKLRELTSSYNSMSKEMRESEVGQNVANEMKTLNESVNEANMRVSNFKDNIGNYPKVMEGVVGSNSAVGRSMQSLGIMTDTTAGAFGKTMVNSLKAVGMQMKALMANPLILGLAVIVGVIMAIVEAIKRSDNAMTALQRAFAPITEFIDIVIQGVTIIAEGVTKALEWIMTLGGTVETEGQKAVRIMDEIEDLRRENVKQQAKDEAEIAELREKAGDKEAFTAEERKKALQEAKRIEEESVLRRQKLMEMELEQFRLENIRNNQTDEYKDKEAEMEAKITGLKKEQAELNRSLLRGLNTINKEIEAQAVAEQKAQDERIKIWKATQLERKKIEEKIADDLENLTLEMMKEGQEKEIASIQLQGERKLEELRKQLATEANLTAKAKADLSAVIKLQEEKLQSDINAIIDKYADEQEAVEEAKRLADKESKTAKELQQQADAQALKLEQRRLELENELLFELEQEQIKNDALLELKKEGNEEILLAQFGTLEAYELAVLQSNEKLKKANADVVSSQKAQQIQMLQSVGVIAGSMSDLFGSIAGDSKALAGFQKALGFVEIMTNMAIGISRAIGKTGGEPFSLSLLITSIVGGITSAIGILSKTQEPPMPSTLQKGGSGGGGGATVSIPSINIPTSASNPTLAMQASRNSENQATTVETQAGIMANMPPQEVIVSEVAQGLNKVEVKEAKSTF